MEIIDKVDEEKKSVDERLSDMGEASADQVKILAVTSCPTGIAHTYMAAEGLEKAAKAQNCFIKVETRGSGGAKNVLTGKEIEEADCIIVAADAQVPMDRFDGKKVIERQVSDGINKADELISLAISGDVPVYHSANAPAKTSGSAKAGGSIGHQIYTQLMNGVSHMLPFAAADPLHVLPSCIIGSAAAGALSMAFGCTLMAPHGGIFVVPVMGNALMYLAALVVGTAISTVLLGVLKKKAEV